VLVVVVVDVVAVVVDDAGVDVVVALVGRCSTCRSRGSRCG
jgi:Fe-S cluster biogenesis protein NfuA